MSRRTDRLNSLLRDELSVLIQREVRDPRVGTLVSVTAVETATDLQTARVFVSVLGDKKEREASVKALNTASGFLRKKLSERVEMRQVPSLQFMADKSIEEGQKLLALIDQVASESKGASQRRTE